MVQRRALLVGCNYPKSKSKLNGAVNDVFIMKKLLMDVKGFREDKIKIMVDTDDKYEFPKKRKILNELEKLCSGRKPGDVIVFHFSGHGAQVKSDDPDEEDGYDECIIAANMKPIRDDQLKACIDKLPDGVKFTMTADSCHSGGMLDHKEIIIESERAGGKGELPDLDALDISDDSDDNNDNDDKHAKKRKEVKKRKMLEKDLVQEQDSIAKAKGKKRKDKKRKKYRRAQSRDIGVLLTGCQSDELSSDCRAGKKSYGAMTKCLDKTMRAHPDASAEDLVRHLRKEMAKKKYKQNPSLECEKKHAVEAFIC
mmetsp:Transcript_3812/g.11335  ORF Transcript_3812/g.11335 Transcript_3812/m.11335 type:complete len:311 (-) Transcript_3812:1149-2081(-)